MARRAERRDRSAGWSDDVKDRKSSPQPLPARRLQLPSTKKRECGAVKYAADRRRALSVDYDVRSCGRVAPSG